MKTTTLYIAVLLFTLKLSGQKIVILGSSTAFGYGASTYSKSWSGRLESYYKQNKNDRLDTTVINIALGGSVSYNGMPSDYHYPSNRPAPDTARNITKALSYKPDVIIVCYASNDAVKSYTAQETFTNFSTIFNKATEAGVRCFIATPQPRNNISKVALNTQLKLRDTVLKTFGDFALNVWDSIVTKDTSCNILPAIAYKDGIHLNDSGHAIIFRQVISKSLFRQFVLPLAVTITASPITCFNSSTLVTVNASGGLPPYTGTGNFTAAAGMYKYVVSDARGDTTSASITIKQPDSLYINAVVRKSVSSYGASDAIIAAAAKGGAAPYLFNANQGVYISDTVFKNLQAGAYLITVKDSLGCINKTQNIITQPDPPKPVTIASSGIRCHGGYDTLIISANFGKAPYKYSSNGTFYQNSNVLRVKAGSYTVYVKDFANTIQTATVDIIQPSAFTFMTSSKPVSCFGYKDGCITLKYTGGLSPYMFRTDSSSYYKADTLAQNLKPGSYKINAHDSNGCIVSKTVIVTEPSSLNATSSATEIACYNNNSILTTSTTGGTGTKVYSFDKLNYHTGYKAAVKAGTYTVTVKDSKGCIATSNAVTIAQPALLTGNQLNLANVTSKGSADGSVTLTGVGGKAPYQYSIDGINYQNSGFFDSLKSAKYSFRIVDTNGCKTSYNVTINIPNTPVIARRSFAIPLIDTSRNNINFKVRVFPNPSSNEFILYFQDSFEKKIQVNIFTLYGIKIYSQTVAGNRFLKLGSAFSAGMYFAEVINGNELIKIKLLKIK